MVRRIEVSPVGRMENLSNLLRGSSNDSELSIPCGNFSRQYACMCDYYGLPYREEVAWVSCLLCLFSSTVIGTAIINQFIGCGYNIHVPQLEGVEPSRF